MKRLLPWIAVPLLLLGAAMLIADIGASGLWIAVVKVAVALGVFAERWRSPAGRRWRPRPGRQYTTEPTRYPV